MPVYGLMIAFHTFVFTHLANGPLWKKIAVQQSDYCVKNWWTNVLFVNNYLDAEHPVRVSISIKVRPTKVVFIIIQAFI